MESFVMKLRGKNKNLIGFHSIVFLISYFNESARNLKLKRQVEMMKSLQREAREKEKGE
jgi:hypothetical protein